MHAAHPFCCLANLIRYYEFLSKNKGRVLVENRALGSNKANEDTMNTKPMGLIGLPYQKWCRLQCKLDLQKKAMVQI